MNYIILVLIGAAMGLFGGLLGIGGSLVMIPAMVFAFGENQHLYQAAAMICNFFVSVSATIAHRREQILIAPVVKFMLPAAAAGAIAGVMLSNASIFSHGRSYILARLFGVFLLYVIYHNAVRLYRYYRPPREHKSGEMKTSPAISSLIGFATGIAGGLLGLGGGTVCVPLQQVLLKMPLKKAIANSAATIIVLALVGALLKNATLEQHNIVVADSLKIAVVVLPSAAVFGFLGARLMHVLPRRYVRMVFICLLLLAAYRMLTA